MDKPLLRLSTTVLSRATEESGLGFFVAPGLQSSTAYAVLSDGSALPLQADASYYDVNDLLSGVPIPAPTSGSVSLGVAARSRAAASALLSSFKVSPKYVGGPGAFPLVGTLTLVTATTFYRFLQSPKDSRFKGGNLLAGTYLTTQLEFAQVSSGFAAVGRFALPIPLPACYVLQYELPPNTTLQVGTVAPLFGQAGGGVEVCLTAPQSAVLRGSMILPAC